jgi:hypothetical protein
MNIVGICCPYVLCKAKGLFNWTLESCLLNICSSIGRDLPPWDGPIWKDICKLLCTVTICIDSVPSKLHSLLQALSPWLYKKSSTLPSSHRPDRAAINPSGQTTAWYFQGYIHAVFCIPNRSASVASTNPSEGTVHKAPNAITSTRCINCPRVLLNVRWHVSLGCQQSNFFRNEWRDRSHYP